MASDLELPLILRTAHTEDLFCTGHTEIVFVLLESMKAKNPKKEEAGIRHQVTMLNIIRLVGCHISYPITKIYVYVLQITQF